MASGSGKRPKSPPTKPVNPKKPVAFGYASCPPTFGVLIPEDLEHRTARAWLPYSGLVRAMQGRGRFHVSASDKRHQAPPQRLNIQQACRLQQRLISELEHEDNDRKVVLGICAMAKKSYSKPMKEIIQRLVDNFDRLQVVVFDEDTILNKPVEEWPIVNGLVSFFSHGFPLEKAIAYRDLRNPFIVNDLDMQYILQDRRKVYAMMKENDIPHPRFAVLDRENDPDCKVVETEDSIEVNGNLFMKPFVEKPVDAEDHNIYIYFPVSAGGGSTRLFRKVKDRSSIYSRFCRVRSKGSYLYEDFMPTDGTDVKVYTVGPDYQHAEARKSPALDGKVERDAEGKEIRYPVLLNNREKLIARTVCKVFKQNVCGFDLLRANGQHYVCDVNGFSFVKTSSKYYDDCAKILGTLVMRACCPQLHIPYPMCTAPEDIPVVQTTSGSMMELRSVIAVIRHGDRTPKQKMKMEVKNKKFFDLFEKYGGFKTGQLKLKKPKQLQEVLDIVRHLLAESQVNEGQEVEEKKAKLNQLKLVLEMYEFSGINRKVQLKYQPNGRPPSSSSEDESPRDPSLVLILKWGGELTPAGRIQAENLGKAFRTLYPGGQGQFEAPGLGFLRLHSTFRHDLKIYASDEGRVQMTAAAFTKGLLALEGELTPILVQMVKSANTNGLLDGESNTSKYQIVVKEKLKELFNQDHDFTEEDVAQLAATNSISLVNAMEFVKNPYQMCCRVHEMIKEITTRIRYLKVELKSRDLSLFNGESWELLIRRWAKLEKDFRLKNGCFDISKIPDIYDCIKYDLQHNQTTLQYQRSQELFMCSKALADIVIPQEYGMTIEERLHIGQSYCTPLLRKIRCDLWQCVKEPMDDSATRLDSKYSKGVASPERFVRTRLYFTSESHIHSLLSMLRYGDFLDEEKDEQWKRSMDFMGACAELNYMSQIVIMMFEDPAKDEHSDERFHVELHFSPGAYTSCDEKTKEPKGMGFRPKQNRDKSMSTEGPAVIFHGTDSVEGITPLTEEAVDIAAAATSSKNQPVAHSSASVPASLMQEDLAELMEEDLFAEVSHSDKPLCSKSDTFVTIPSKHGFKAHSPDPDAPEWDWGDDDEDQEVEKAPKAAETKGSIAEASTSERGRVPRQMSVPLDSTSEKTRALAFSLPRSIEKLFREETPEYTFSTSWDSTDPIHITESGKLSYDEKRSRSLEDGCRDLLLSKQAGYIQRNYRTIHLPLSNEMAMKPLASILFFGHAPKALEGFHKVPLLHPLETLHNTLTFHHLDDFLGRVTVNRFPVPDLSALKSLASKSVLSLNSPIKASEQLPSSSNSSGGPNSPTITTPADLMKTLDMYIGHHNPLQEEPKPGGGKTDTNLSQNSVNSNESLDSGLPHSGEDIRQQDSTVKPTTNGERNSVVSQDSSEDAIAT